MFGGLMGKRGKNPLGIYEMAEIDLPQRPETHMIYVIGSRTIYVNTGADKTANVRRKFDTEKEFAQFVAKARGW